MSIFWEEMNKIKIKLMENNLCYNNWWSFLFKTVDIRKKDIIRILQNSNWISTHFTQSRTRFVVLCRTHIPPPPPTFVTPLPLPPIVPCGPPLTLGSRFRACVHCAEEKKNLMCSAVILWWENHTKQGLYLKTSQDQSWKLISPSFKKTVSLFMFLFCYLWIVLCFMVCDFDRYGF